MCVCAWAQDANMKRDDDKTHQKNTHTLTKPSLFSHKVACCALFIARFIMHSSKAVFVGGLVCFKPNQFCFRLFILCIRHDWCENKAHHIVHILFFTRNFFPFLVFFHFERWSNLCLQQVNQHIKKTKFSRKYVKNLMKWIMQNKTVTKSFASHLNKTHNAYKIEKKMRLWKFLINFGTREMDLIIHSTPKKRKIKTSDSI